MKGKFIIIALIVLSVQFVSAQKQETANYYLTGELNLGNYLGFDFNLNYHFKNDYFLKAGFSGNIRTPESLPDNYSGGLSLVFSAGIEGPYDHFLNYKINFGKKYDLSQKGTIQASISVGIGYTILKEPGNWQYVESDAWLNLSENYTYSYHKYSTVSLIINPAIEFPITKYFGFSVSPMIQLNKDRTYYGIGIGTMVGKLR